MWRNVVPEIRPLMKLQDWCAENDGALKLNLHPRAQYSIKTLPSIPKRRGSFAYWFRRRFITSRNRSN